MMPRTMRSKNARKRWVLDRFLRMARDSRKGIFTRQFNENTSCLRELITGLKNDVAGKKLLTEKHFHDLKLKLKQDSPRDSAKYGRALDWLYNNWFPVPARLVFRLHNNYAQGSEIGICTAASLDWCKQSLRHGRLKTVSREQLVDPAVLNAQMAVMREKDRNPALQTDLAGLRIVGKDRSVSSARQAIDIIGKTRPYHGIFWTAGHTMALRFCNWTHAFEFFDIEQGLFRAWAVGEIEKKINYRYQGDVKGCRVVSL